MSDYKVGRGKPPKETRFKPGNKEWRKREEKRKKRKETKFSPGREFCAVLGSTMTVKRKGRIRREVRLQVIVDSLIAAALQGDIDAANDLLSFHLDAAAAGDFRETTLIFDAPGDDLH